MSKIFVLHYDNAETAVNLDKVQRIDLIRYKDWDEDNNPYFYWNLYFYYGLVLTNGEWYEEGYGHIKSEESFDKMRFDDESEAKKIYKTALKMWRA